MYKGFFIAFIVAATYSFCELPIKFDNQRDLIEQIEEEIDMISNSMQNILENPANSPQGYNDLVNRVLKKDASADEISNILSKEFLQKYIAIDDVDIEIKLMIIHKMLNLCFQVKNSVDMALVNSLKEELESFKKLMQLNYKKDPDYKDYRFKRYRQRKNKDY